MKENRMQRNKGENNKGEEWNKQLQKKQGWDLYMKELE
jgi:hypothetical protein